jgi:hypothetical protein
MPWRDSISRHFISQLETIPLDHGLLDNVMQVGNGVFLK